MRRRSILLLQRQAVVVSVSGGLEDFAVVVAATDANLVANALVGAMMAMDCWANFLPVRPV